MIKREDCRGCTDDYYNVPGNTFCKDGRCWNAKTGRMMTRYATGVWTRPTQKGAFTQVRKPSCYHQNGTAYYNELPNFVRLDQVVGSAAYVKRVERECAESSKEA